MSISTYLRSSYSGSLLDRGVILLVVIWTCALPVIAQHTDLDSTYDHEVLITQMRNAKDLMYREALHRYDTYLAAHPDDLPMRLERCAFIGNALYDEYEEYNPNEEAHDSCLTALGERYPDEPSVILARADQQWSDAKVELLSSALERMRGSGVAWTDEQRAELHRGLASSLYYDDRAVEALEHIEQAARYSEADRGSLLRAEILMATDAKKEALEALNMRIDTSEGAWTLQQRAELLLQLKDHKNALRVYREVERLDSNALDLGDLALTLEGAGEIEVARSYFVRDTIRSWGVEAAALALFEHDLRHQPSDTCTASYNAFRDHGYEQDPLAIHRLRLFFHAPLQPWKARDLLGVFAFLGLFVFMLLLPYVWVLPVHFIGTRWPRMNGKALGVMPWGLKDFWWITAGYLVATLVALMACPSCLQSYFSDQWTDEATDPDLDARIMLVFLCTWAAWTVPMLIRSGLGVFRSPQWSMARSLGQGVLYLLGFRFLGSIYLKGAARLFDKDLGELMGWLSAPLAVTRAEMLAFMSSYGLGTSYLMMAVLVPLYEEIVFRGVILNSVTRYLGFGKANLLQALLFAAVHGDLFLAPYFFGFGLFTGLLVKRSESLTSGVVFHVLNNLLAVAVVAASR